MPVSTRSEREVKSKDSVHAKRIIKNGPAEKRVRPSIQTIKIYVMQDPESRTFRDEITVDGKRVERIVERGCLKTESESLALFMQSKGWILLNITTKEI